MPNIYFPNLNLSFNIDPIAFTVFGIEIYWYGILITTGIMMGLLLATYIAKKENMDPELIWDFLLYDLVFAIIGARMYYVAFEWSYYKDNLDQIFNLRKGGIAIYGAIIASVIVAIIFTRIKKINFLKFADVASYGLILGQIIGRYGNFVNKEAFGDYTNSFFAMRILKSEAATALTPNILENTVIVNGLEYIQVHPTFLYESVWNMCVLAIMLFYRKYKKANGEIFFIYAIGYGIGRFWIEGLRTDQLVVQSLGIAASQIVAVASIIAGIVGIIWCRRNQAKVNN